MVHISQFLQRIHRIMAIAATIVSWVQIVLGELALLEICPPGDSLNVGASQLFY